MIAFSFLAERATERIGELIATNEQLMLANPRVIEKLYMNKRVRMLTADRLIELAVRNQIELGIPAFKEAAAAIRNELVSEPTPEPTFDDILFRDIDRVALAIAPAEIEEDTHEVDEEGQEYLKDHFVPLYQQIGQMTVTQKIRRAMLGTAAERLLLVRDSNRLVSTAAAKSPLLRESEAVRISASRAISDDVLRIIANNREFNRNYQIKYNFDCKSANAIHICVASHPTPKRSRFERLGQEQECHEFGDSSDTAAIGSQEKELKLSALRRTFRLASRGWVPGAQCQ